MEIYVKKYLSLPYFLFFLVLKHDFTCIATSNTATNGHH